MKRIFLSLILLVAALGFGQDQELMTINHKPVKVSEFERMYTKNLDLVQDPEQKDIDNYQKLYIDYRLELEDAFDQKYDTLTKFVRELKGYRKDLAKKYLSDNDVLNKMISEAYERMKYDVHVAHILIQVSPDAEPKDTLKAYNKILNVYKKAKKGADFNQLAQQYSQDPSAKENKGDLDYITVFNTVYPFETKAYNTPVGEISKPFRTRFGYHIIKVLDKRPARGKIEVAHIMTFDNRNEKNKSEADSKTRIFEVYNKLKQGTDSFGNLAKKFSDDRATGKYGGKLRAFGIREMLPEFENAAFTLNNPGDYTQPIHTKYGWHIISLIKKYPIESFDKLKDKLKYQVMRDERSKLSKDKLYERIQKEFPVVMKASLDEIYPLIDDKFFENKWEIPQGSIADKTLFTIAGKENVSFKDFFKYLYRRQYKNKNVIGNKKTIIDNFFKRFKKQKLFSYYENHLEDIYPEFAGVMNEYRDGLLIFYIKSDKVWEKSVKDTVGLQKYFEAHKQNYVMPERLEVMMVQVHDKKIAKKIMKDLSKNKDNKYIQETYKDQKPIIKHKTYLAKDKFIKKYDLKSKGQAMYKDNDDYVILSLLKVLPSGVPELEQVKGKVTNDYQKYLESEWLKELRAKYPVKINKKAWKKIRAKYKK